jgi:hypothetical protein
MSLGGPILKTFLIHIRNPVIHKQPKRVEAQNERGLPMGKFVIYALTIVIAAFVLEFFRIVDIPYLEIPDYLSGKTEMVHKTEDMMDQIK